MEWEEKMNTLTNRVCNLALSATPILNIPDPPSAIPIGCGIYLKVGSDYFLLSAGHLLNLEDWPKIIAPGNGTTMTFLNGTIATTFENPKSKNIIDFAVLKFAKRQIKHLINGRFEFIEIQNIMINHKVDPKGYYVVAGYPVSGVKKKAGKAQFNPIPVKFITYSIESSKYSKYNFDPEHFILVKYQRKVAPFGSKEKQITKELQGISGSGLWYIPDINDRVKGIPKLFLVGIMTENHKEKGFLAALKIDFATQVIREIFNHKEIEESKFKEVKDPNTIFCAHID